MSISTRACFYFLLFFMMSCSSIRKAQRLKDPVYQHLLINQKVTVKDKARDYDLFIPDRLHDQKRYPLVISLHGHFGSKENISGRSGRASPHKVWMDIGQRDQVFIAYPEGKRGGDGHRGWNGCRADALSNPQVDDVAFLSTLILTLIQKYPIDSNRVYIVGTSNGGGMTYRMGVEATHLLAAIAMVIFSAPAKSECTPTHHPISVLLMNGTKDPLTPYMGGVIQRGKFQRGSVLSVEDALKEWLVVNEIKEQWPKESLIVDQNTSDGLSIEIQKSGYGKLNTQVVHYKMKGAGHVEPSIKEKMNWLYLKMVGSQNHDVEMAEEIWKFFQNKVRIIR